MSQLSYYLGIDLGTTFTAAAIHKNGQTSIFPLGGQSAAIPSVVLLREDDTVLTGEAAVRRAIGEPERVAREFKRRIGDTTPIIVGGTPYSAEALTARLIKAVLAEVEKREGSPPEIVAISHPANWGQYKNDLLAQAVRLADLDPEKVRFLTEPEAAAISYAAEERVESGEIVAVYDLGGGTFDAAVLCRADAAFEFLGKAEGIERLGGIDFDAAVLAHVSRSLDGALDKLDPGNPATRAGMARLRQDCVEAKEALSVDTDATVPVLLPELQTEVRITRVEFENLIRPALMDSIAAMRRSFANAGVTAEDVSKIVLVGGSSRIPLIGQLISSELGCPVVVDAHPKHAIALGAALLAADAIDAAPEQRDSSPLPPARAIAANSSLPINQVTADGPGPETTQETQRTPEPLTVNLLSEPVTPVANQTESTFAYDATPPTGAVPAPGSLPAPGTPGEPGANRPGLMNRILVIGAIVAAIAIAGGYLIFSGTDPAQASGEVFLQPAQAAGVDPFFGDAEELVDLEPVELPTPQGPSTLINEGDNEGDVGKTEVSTVDGASLGLYGGSLDNSRCNPEVLIQFLEANPAKAKAWADAQGVPTSGIRTLVDSFTPVVLLHDTRVTNHGFKDGVANPIQSVLQAGSAVLVDETGSPRVRCACGNPLGSPVAQSTRVSYTGTQWTGFRSSDVQVVFAGNPSERFVLQELEGGQPIARLAGTDGSNDAAASAAEIAAIPSALLIPELGSDPDDETGESSATTSAPTTTVATATTTEPITTTEPTTTTTETPPSLSIVGKGSVSANSTFEGFPVSNALDGDAGTSWFSTGPGAGPSVFTWMSSSHFIDQVSFVGNDSNSNPDFRTGFGFTSVTIEVLDGGTVVFTNSGSGYGAQFSPQVQGDQVRLIFTGHDSADCGGFADLNITGYPSE